MPYICYISFLHGAKHVVLQCLPDLLSLIQISGDLDELQTIFNGGKKLRDIGTGHCSALIKLLPGNTDLFTSQVTWNNYGSMLRILKRYHFGYHLTPGATTFTLLCNLKLHTSLHLGIGCKN